MLDKGQLIAARYHITAEIARGGMGAVYEAHDEKNGSVVALKESFFQEPELQVAFRHEARLLEHLSHHALPQFFEYFELQGRQYIVMELVPGQDLRRQIKEGVKFSAAKILLWMAQLLDVLEYLHSHNVVHRDLKPANLKIGPRHNLMLLDFGLAKGRTGQMTMPAHDASTPGYTLNYAAPEQVRRGGTTPRSDLYALGATIYNLLTNIEPTDALRREDALSRGVPDPLRHINECDTGLPRTVGNLLMKLLEVKEENRPASAAAVREELEHLFPSLSQHSHSTPRPASFSLPQISTASLVAVQESEPANFQKIGPPPAAEILREPAPPRSTGSSWPEEVAFQTSGHSASLSKSFASGVSERIAHLPPMTEPKFSPLQIIKAVAGLIVLVLAVLGLWSLLASAPAGPTAAGNTQPTPPAKTAPTAVPAPAAVAPRPARTVDPKKVDKQVEVNNNN